MIDLIWAKHNLERGILFGRFPCYEIYCTYRSLLCFRFQLFWFTFVVFEKGVDINFISFLPLEVLECHGSVILGYCSFNRDLYVS